MVKDEGEESSGKETTTPANVQQHTIIARLASVVERQTQLIQQLIHQTQPHHHVNHVDLLSERFQNLNPPIFQDVTDPLAAEDWLRTIDNMFKYCIEIDLEVEKVLCASFMLRGSAGHWWDNVKCIEDVTAMTWERFKEIFGHKYITTAPVRRMKMTEFIQLKQGTMTVTDYVHKFEQLSRFAQHMVSTETLKVERLLEGLRPDLYRDVSMAGIQGVTYLQVVERAHIAEQAEQRIRQAQEGWR